MKYIKLPRILFTDEKYKNLSLDAKIIYAFMLNRFSLSEFKGWKDKNGKTFIFYTSENLSLILGKSVRSISRYLGELKKANLIYSEKPSINRPTLYYLQKAEQFCPALQDKSDITDTPFFPVSYTDNNYTDNSYYTPEMVEQHILYKLSLCACDKTDEDNQQAQI